MCTRRQKDIVILPGDHQHIDVRYGNFLFLKSLLKRMKRRDAIARHFIEDVITKFRLAVSPIGQRQNAHNCLAGCAGIQLLVKPFPYALVSLSRQQIVPYLRVPKSLWLTLQAADDMAVIDTAAPAVFTRREVSRQREGMGRSQVGHDSVMIDMQAQFLAYQAGGHRVNHTLDQDRAGGADPDNCLGVIHCPLER